MLGYMGRGRGTWGGGGVHGGGGGGGVHKEGEGYLREVTE